MKGECFMRKRYQEGSVKKVKGRWIGQWWENGHRRNLKLGLVSDMTKAQAQIRVADIVRPINNRECASNPDMLLKDFVKDIFFGVHRPRWKRSTAMTSEQRISYHIRADLGDRKIGAIGREELHSFLDRKAKAKL